MTLSNKNGTVPNSQDVETATKFLHDKFLIGLSEEFNTSIHRFKKYFHWNVPEYRKHCLNNLIFKKPINQLSEVNIRVKALQEGTKEWQMLSYLNRYDIQLYENAKKIFQEQGKL